MTHFETYHWQDHGPGNWKFNLTVSLLAFGLVFAAFPDRPADSSSVASITARPVEGVDHPVVYIPQRDLPAASLGTSGQPMHCPIAAAEHADS